MPVSDHGFSVPFSFPVHFVRDVWEPRNGVILQTLRRFEPERRHRVLVVVDEALSDTQSRLLPNIAAYFAAHASALELVSAPVIVPGGEAVKNDLSHVLGMLGRINDLGLDRQSFIIVIGGGAVLDMVSFAAAIAHRGIRIVRMPTTVLAQADSGIAVKNSVNLFGKKNFIGTFVPPFAVINDIQSLASLPLRDKIAGVSEAVKVSLLRCPTFFKYLELHARALAEGELDVLGPVVQRSAELHLAHICGNGDPFELGSARPLDFGHWSAHKLESMTQHRIRHGEAVSIGMALDLTYSVLQGFLDESVKNRILHLLTSIGLPIWDDALESRSDDGHLTVLHGLREFREHLGGQLHVTMLADIGASFEVTTMSDAHVAQAIATLSRWRRAKRPPIADAAVTVVQ